MTRIYTRIYIGMENAIAIVQSRQDQWQLDEYFTGTLPECVAVDPYKPERVYCGTSNKGLWYSDDAGLTWSAVGQGIPHETVMSVAVSASERVGEYGVVWAGTEPSRARSSALKMAASTGRNVRRYRTFHQKQPGASLQSHTRTIYVGYSLILSIPSASSWRSSAVA